MKRIMIKKSDTECSDAIGYIGEGAEHYSWKAFCKYIKDSSWLGFSAREIIPQVVNEEFAIIDGKEELIEDFLNCLCAATSIDFSFWTVNQSK
jgi:hypothetical protein